MPFTALDVDRPAYFRLREACRAHRFLPAFCEGILLDAAMVGPSNPARVAAIRRLTHQEVRTFEIGQADFAAAVAALETEEEAASDRNFVGEDPPCLEAWESAPAGGREAAIRLVVHAHAAGASDILVDEQEGWTEIALKVDGRKTILPPVDRSAGAGLLRAFKEMAGLSTQTVNRWQSGAASVRVGEGRRAELRLETTPTVHGESLVARLQDRERQIERMRRLPFPDPAQVARVEACLARRQGLIVATGPTGHGKTTTLYACLGRLDRSILNIRTLEDPVEFIVPWITQIPVGAGTGRSFAEGLRSLLRQAPDVILMGEIRDAEVAETCIEAVNTGHLILATLHTRSAIGAVTRLIDLGISGREAADALLLAIGQRLVRRLCSRCRRAEPPTAVEAAAFEREGLPVPASLWRPVGCGACAGEGERGRLPLFELFQPDDDALVDRIAADPFDERALRATWVARGGSPLARQGLSLAARGEIAFAEVPV